MSHFVYLPISRYLQIFDSVFSSLNNSAAIGSIVENFVYLTLLTKNSKEYVHFYRTIAGSEIDFVVEKENGKNIICEVKYKHKVKAPLAMKNFQKNYPNLIEKNIIITKNLLKKEGDIYYLPVSLLPFVNF